MPQNCPVSCNTCDLITTLPDGRSTTGRPATRPADDIITTVSAPTTSAPPIPPMTEAVTQSVEQQTQRVIGDDGSGDVETVEPTVFVSIIMYLW